MTISRALGILIGAVADAVVGDPRRAHPVALFGTYAAAIEKRLNGFHTTAREETPDLAPPRSPDDSALANTHAAQRSQVRPNTPQPLTQPAAITPPRATANAPDEAPASHRLVASPLLRGGIAWAVAIAPPLALGVLIERLPLVPRTAATAWATWAVLGGKTLGAEADAVAGFLKADDLPGARQRLTHLVGRITDNLSESDVARAAIESVAENSSDAVVAPLVWGTLLGAPGLLTYRAINTLDAMWGHRTPRFARFGTVAARVDDVANLLPARVAAAIVAAQPGVSALHVARIIRRDSGAHPSPNAGVIEAAFASALSLTLGGKTVYSSGSENRPTLGDGHAPRTQDLHRAVRLLAKVSASSTALSVVVASCAPATVFGRRTTTTSTPS